MSEHMRLSADEAVHRAERVMSHAWMVRTFVKHAPEVEAFPELMHLARTVFDTSRALETCVHDPPGYLRMLRKKISKLRAAAEQFSIDAPAASDHTNFKQAVLSMTGCVAELHEILAAAPTEQRPTTPMPPTSSPLPAGDDVEPATESPG